VRAAAVHPDVVVVESAIWQTNCVVVRGGPDEAFLIDSPVLPPELDALPELCRQSGFAVRGLLATHADWDHLLGPLAFPEAALGVGEPTARRLAAEPGAAQRAMRAWDEEHYVRRPRPLALGSVQELPVPGQLEVADRPLELHPAEGHTADGTAVVVPWAEVLCCGDYVSPVEIPMLSEGGSLPAYRETLERLRELAGRVQKIVPGHGEVLDPPRALELIAEDLAYLDALERDGARAQLPDGRRTAAQRRIHGANVQRAA
jgi:glyoxylase-like metal-dependent hydrolase (beta-lactamase superfamily II)